jgi:hypothetical protein
VSSYTDLARLVAFIQHELIKELLYWKFAKVEALNEMQAFALLDVGCELETLTSSCYQFVNKVLSGVNLDEREREIAKIGLCSLMAIIGSKNPDAIGGEQVKTRLRHGLSMIPSKSPSHWLAHIKTVWSVLRECLGVNSRFQGAAEWVWEAPALSRIIQRIFIEDRIRFELIRSLKCMIQGLERGVMSVYDFNLRVRAIVFRNASAESCCRISAT